MKIWPFDTAADPPAGWDISPTELREGAQNRSRRSAEAVGDRDGRPSSSTRCGTCRRPALPRDSGPV